MSDELAQAVAAEVRALAESAGLSGRALSRRSGIAHNTLATKLRGEVPFDVGELGDVAAVLGVDAALIMALAEKSSRARTSDT